MILALAAVSPPSPDEAALAAAINAYRGETGLPPVRFSAALTAVARAHVDDLDRHRPDTATNAGPGPCSMHSWSAFGAWTPVCYTVDHAQAAAMWSKPREISRGAYPGPGFEIAWWCSDAATPAAALASWRASPAHDAVLRERGSWHGWRWQAMGVAVRGHYAVAWFGREPDVSVGFVPETQ